MFVERTVDAISDGDAEHWLGQMTQAVEEFE